MVIASKEGHTLKQFDEELAELRKLVLEMGGLVEDQINQAVKALDDEDLDTAREVIARDHMVNGMDIKADEKSVRLLARRQPVGSDLRMIISLSKTVTDLERIGDEAEKIARMAVHLYDSDNPISNTRMLRDVFTMGKLASAMLHDSLDALARMDIEKAVRTAQGDEELDREFRSSLRRLITYMMEDPRTITHSIDILFIIKALERIGDHSKNIAEYVIYLVKGRDVRHASPDTLATDALKAD